MKTRILLSTILAVITLTGCQETLFINKGDLTEVKTGVGLLSDKVDAGQALWTEVAKVTGKNIEETAAINKKIDEYQPMITKAATQLAEAPTLIEGMIEANKTTAPLNPYAGIIDLLLKLLVPPSVVGTGLAVTKAMKNGREKVEAENAVERIAIEKNIVDRKYSAEKKGLEALRMKSPELYEENYALVGALRKELGV